MQLVEALCYKMEGHGFLIIEGIFEIFHWLQPFIHTVAPGSTQSPTEMSTRDLPWRVKVAGV
jgi:hypothetical protein